MIDIQKFLTEQAGGGLLIEINDTLQSLVRDCRDTGKKGTLSIALALEPMMTRDGGTQIKITPAVTSKNPKYDAGVGIYWLVTDEAGNPVGLEQENPAQMKLMMDLEREAK